MAEMLQHQGELKQLRKLDVWSLQPLNLTPPVRTVSFKPKLQYISYRDPEAMSLLSFYWGFKETTPHHKFLLRLEWSVFRMWVDLYLHIFSSYWRLTSWLCSLFMFQSLFQISLLFCENHTEGKTLACHTLFQRVSLKYGSKIKKEVLFRVTQASDCVVLLEGKVHVLQPVNEHSQHYCKRSS